MARTDQPRARPRAFLRDIRDALAAAMPSSNRKDTPMPTTSRNTRIVAHQQRTIYMNEAPKPLPTRADLPEQARIDYDTAPEPSATILLPYLQPAIERRAAEAEAAWHQANNAGRSTVTIPRKREVLDAGPQREDEPVAEHLYRLDYARQLDAARKEETERHRRRHEGRCRSCLVLDQPTRVVRIELIPGSSQPGDTVTVPGGPVCRDCEMQVREQYRAKHYRAKTHDGKDRAETVARFLNADRPA